MVDEYIFLNLRMENLDKWRYIIIQATLFWKTYDLKLKKISQLFKFYYKILKVKSIKF